MIEEFMRRYQVAYTNWMLWSSIHNACYSYAVPQKNRFWRPSSQQGDQRNTRVYDTTAVECTKTFVSKMHNMTTPAQTQWLYLELEPNKDEDVEEFQARQQVLDDYMKKLFSFIHRSNFDMAINESYFDLAVGTAAIVINYRSDEVPLYFSSIPINELQIEDSKTGVIDTWFRTWQNVSIRDVCEIWKDAVIPTHYIAQSKNPKEEQIKTLIEGVLFCGSNEEFPYNYIVTDGDNLLVNRPMKINPGIVWRFQKINNDVYGRGPIMDALPSIITLNEIMELELASANFNVFRPYMAFSDMVFNPENFKIRPMTIIPIAPMSANGMPPLMPLADASNPNFAQVTIADLRMQVTRLLFADSAIPQDQTQPVSATQLMIANNQIAERAGPNLSRIQKEFLWPTIKQCMDILHTSGQLRKPNIEGVKMKFHYQSAISLANAQKQISLLVQYGQIMQGMLGQMGATAFINVKEMPYHIGHLMQLDKNLINKPEDVAKAMQDMAQQQQDQQMMMQQQSQGEAFSG